MASASISSLLDKVLTTKLQRKAKTVIMTIVQFVLTNTFIVMSAAEQAETQNKTISQGLKLTIGISTAYTVLLACFLLIHGNMQGDSAYQTNSEIEDAYAKTNQVQLVDGLLEIPLAIKFKGPFWWLIWIFWALFLGIAVAFITLVIFLPDFEVNNSTSIAVSAAVFELYEITGDFSEYWIYTRHSQKSYEGVENIQGTENECLVSETP